MDDSFELYDLEVTVVGDASKFVCSQPPGSSFRVEGENFVFEESKVSMYVLAALIPLLPAKQRHTHSNDWMTTDTEVACPDSNCGARFKISRLARRTFRHSEVTVVPLPGRSK